MAWYQRPIQPLDPVVVSSQPKPPFRYVRDNFAGTGQNSHDIPPTQDQAMWQALTNVQPITKGAIERRWGYNQFTTVSGTPNRLYNFQSDSLNTRAIIAAGLGSVSAFNENGTSYNSNIFTTSAVSGTVRSATSRNYQYFCDGNNALNPSTHRTGDSVKWDGSTVNNAVTNVGIINTDVTTNIPSGSTANTLGPSTPGAAANDAEGPYATGAAWSNLPGTQGTGNGFATANLSISVSFAQLIANTSYGFNAAASSTVAGIQVSFTAFVNSGVGFPLLQVGLCKDGTHPVGTFNYARLTNSASTFTFGSSTNLWGTTWSISDINGSTFGSLISSYGAKSNGVIISVQNVQVTIFLNAGSGGSASSGTGVGIVNVLGTGAVNLTIGRQYYLVANNSLTGHFGDLSPPSGTTGPLTNVEVELLLATYNDPQVDFKYLLAPADGGDPSILYEVQPLVPGLTIASWAIVTNVVTFTGTWTGTPYTNGTTFVVGGLVHGLYLDSQTLTTTSSTGTTLVANFTHANDSATEVGVAGNYTFAIPNSVTTVVDNTPDPTLVLNQPLVYTDTFGNTFGLALNSPPPAGNLLIKHQGRMWMSGVPGASHSVFFSKGIPELTLPNGFIAGKYEEAWPGSNYFDISDGAESVAGFLSDGTSLYIGTQAHIRRLVGNAPSNFQLPQIVHPAAGLINQEVWQLVFNQGAPSGCCWLTPDFRVIQSDFNTYIDIGGPVQDILNSVQPQAQTLAHAAFVATGEYALYILAVPVNSTTQCDTHLIFDLKNRQWFVWKPTTNSLSLMYNITAAGTPQWLFLNGAGTAIDIYQSTASTDGGTAIPVTATTSWLHLSEPTRRKTLTEMQIFGNTGMAVTILGGNNLQDMTGASNDPGNTVVYNRTLRQRPFGTWNLSLAGEECRHRYYQFTFTANNGQSTLLSSYTIAASSLDDVG